VLEFRERLDGFVRLRAGALVEGAITDWRFDNGLLLRLTFHAPNLTVEHGSRRHPAVARRCDSDPSGRLRRHYS
jgi:hypothetical protein